MALCPSPKGILTASSECMQCQQQAYLFIGLKMIHEVIQGINALLDGEVELMVGGAQLVGYLPGS